MSPESKFEVAGDGGHQKDSRINAGKWIFVSAPGHEAEMPTCLRLVRFEGVKQTWPQSVASSYDPNRTDHVPLVMCSSSSPTIRSCCAFASREPEPPRPVF